MDDGDDDGDGEASDDIAPVAEDDGHDDGGEDDEVDGDNDAEDANDGVGMPMGGGGMADFLVRKIFGPIRWDRLRGGAVVFSFVSRDR